MSTVQDRTITVRLHDSCFGGVVRTREVYVGAGLVDAAWVVSQAWNLQMDQVVAVNESFKPLLADSPLEPGDAIDIAPRPGDLVSGIMIAVAIASAAASAWMAQSVSLPNAQSGEESEERRYGFGRYSARAFDGEVVPVPYGEIPRFGGKVVQTVPVESADGSGEDKIRILICLGYGAPHGIYSIGNRFNDFDNVLAADGAVTGIYLRDQEIGTFPNCRVSGRMGTMDQRPIRGFSDIETLRDVGVGGANLRNTSGADRTGSTPSAEAVSFDTSDGVNAVVVRVRLEEGLYKVASSAQVESHTVSYRMRWTAINGSGTPVGDYSAWRTITLTQSNQSGFWSSPRIEIDSTPTRVRIQVERVSLESSDVTVRDAMVWTSVVEIIDSSQSYPGYAMLALELTAGEQLQYVPEVSCLLRGRKVRVHDGTSPPSSPVFNVAFSRNPADIALDYATNAAFGMGLGDTPADINYSQYLLLRDRCNELVERASRPGETAARHTFNFIFARQADHIDNLITILQSARAMPILTGQRLDFIIQRPQSTPVETFTDGSIVRGEDGTLKLSTTVEWTEEGLLRPNQVYLQYEANEAEGDVDGYVYPADDEQWLADETPEQSQERLDGVTDIDELARHAVYKMNTHRYVAEAIEHEITHAFPRVRPGERYDVATSMLGYAASSGRVRPGSTVRVVRLDREVVLTELAPGETYRLRIYHLDGSVETQLVASPAGAYGIAQGITLAADLAQAPLEGAEYSLEIPQRTLVAKPYICQSITFEDNDGDIVWTLSGVEYVEGVYSDVPGEVTVPRYSGLASPSTPPGAVIDVRIYDRQNPVSGLREAQLAWGQRPEDAAITASYHIYRRVIGTTAWVRLSTATVTRRAAVVEITDTTRGYEFVVVAVSYTGAYLSPDDSRHMRVTLMLGSSVLPPPPPSGLAITNVGGNVYDLTWTPVDGAVAYRVGFFAKPGGGNSGDKVFENAADCQTLYRTQTNSINGLRLPLASVGPGDGTVHFYVRSVGANGRMSFTASRISVSNANAPTGMVLKHAFVADLSTGWTNAEAIASTPGTGVDHVPLNNGVDAIWDSGAIDTGSFGVTQLVWNMLTVNRAKDPTLATTPYVVPSLEADQWGVDKIEVDGTRRTGMVHAPYTLGSAVNAQDQAHKWQMELSFESAGGVPGTYGAYSPFGLVSGTFQRYRIRLRMSALAAPYRPGVRALTMTAYGPP